MKKVISLILACSVLLTSCASSTLITSNPSGAKVYINYESVGQTPYLYKDTKIITSTNILIIKKDGYETIESYFCRDEKVNVGAIIGGFFFLFPLLWAMGYKPIRVYELIPVSDNKSDKAKQTNAENE